MSRAPLRYHQPFPPWLRVIVALMAAIPLWGAYDLLVGSGMPLLQWGMAPFLVMGAIALAFGSLFLGLAIFGGARTVTIDRASRLCHVDFNGTFGVHRRFTHPFTQLGEARVTEAANTDGPPSWIVELPGPRKPLRIGSYPEAARAKSEAAMIAAYMAGRA